MDASVFALLIFAIIAFGIGMTVFWIYFLVEVVKTPDAQWRAAGQNQVLHVVLMLLFPVLGTIIYIATARPALQRVGPPPPGYPPSGYYPPPQGYAPPSYPPPPS